MEKKETKLVEALRKDYKELYVKEYTTGWREQRLLRNIELGIMSLRNTEKYISQELSKAREEVLLELLEKKTNYKIEEVGHGYKVTQEYVLVSDIEKELSKLSKKKNE